MNTWFWSIATESGALGGVALSPEFGDVKTDTVYPGSATTGSALVTPGAPAVDAAVVDSHAATNSKRKQTAPRRCVPAFIFASPSCHKARAELCRPRYPARVKAPVAVRVPRVKGYPNLAS
jgi:hypothetical protein